MRDAIAQSPNVVHDDITFDSNSVSDTSVEQLRMDMKTSKMPSECVSADDRFLPIPHQAHCSNPVTVPLCGLCRSRKLTGTLWTMEPFEASIVLRSRPPHKLQSVLHADGDLTEGRSCGETIANNTTRLLSPFCRLPVSAWSDEMLPPWRLESVWRYTTLHTRADLSVLIPSIPGPDTP